MFFIVSYDIVDNKMRTKLSKKLCNYGQRVQYSVFECSLDKNQYKEMLKETLQFVDLEKDSLRIYKLCRDCRKKIASYGKKQGIADDDAPIIV